MSTDLRFEVFNLLYEYTRFTTNEVNYITYDLKFGSSLDVPLDTL